MLLELSLQERFQFTFIDVTEYLSDRWRITVFGEWIQRRIN